MIVVPMKTGEPCPCCGQPIKTKDPDHLYLLGWIKATGFAPISYEEIKKAERGEGQ